MITSNLIRLSIFYGRNQWAILLKEISYFYVTHKNLISFIYFRFSYYLGDHIDLIVDSCFFDKVQLYEVFQDFVTNTPSDTSQLLEWRGYDLWKHYDYHDFGIIGEPYFDADFSKIFYLTDTGRCWDGFNVSVRDKVPVYQEKWVEEGLVYHSTDDIIRALQNGTFPNHLMMTTHPQRWTDNRAQWLKEMMVQRAKNCVKRIIVRKNGRKA